MGLEAQKITAFTNLVSALEDVPTGLTSTQLKDYFDSSPEELRQKFNGAIDVLMSAAVGNSGSENIGARTIVGVNGNTVYAQLLALKSLIDAVTVGQIPLGSLTAGHLNFDPATQAELDTTTQDAILFPMY